MRAHEGGGLLAPALALVVDLANSDVEGQRVGARDVADEIERVLVGTSSEPIQLARERADAVFYVLNVSVRPNDPEEADALALYVAVR